MIDSVQAHFQWLGRHLFNALYTKIKSGRGENSLPLQHGSRHNDVKRSEKLTQLRKTKDERKN